jgi:hypothetical protein
MDAPATALRDAPEGTELGPVAEPVTVNVGKVTAPSVSQCHCTVTTVARSQLQEETHSVSSGAHLKSSLSQPVEMPVDRRNRRPALHG